MSLTDKIALITGSSSGIGAATAITFAKLGACVVITSFDKESLDSVASEIIKVSPKGTNGVLQVVADVTVDDDCKRLINETIKCYGKLDILINNVGIGKYTSIYDANIVDIYDKLMNTNVRSAVLLTHLAVPYLIQTKGIIINTSSIVSIKPIARYIAYCTTKSAIDMFTKCLSLELGSKGIRVNSVNPGSVKTEFLISLGLSNDDSNKVFEKSGQSSCLGRCGEPKDIANVMAFLASDESSFITGINLIADGGGQK